MRTGTAFQPNIKHLDKLMASVYILLASDCIISCKNHIQYKIRMNRLKITAFSTFVSIEDVFMCKHHSKASISLQCCKGSQLSTRKRWLFPLPPAYVCFPCICARDIHIFILFLIFAASLSRALSPSFVLAISFIFLQFTRKIGMGNHIACWLLLFFLLLSAAIIFIFI